MPRKPNATRPNAKTAGATIIAPSPAVLTMNAVPISTTMTMPSQYALKFPATSPDRMPSEAPPSRADVTTSRTGADSVEVKILTSSGMIAPASVPQVMTVESFHQKLPLHGRFLHREQDERDEGHAGDAVRLEAVGARADRVARVVAGAVGDDA